MLLGRVAWLWRIREGDRIFLSEVWVHREVLIGRELFQAGVCYQLALLSEVRGLDVVEQEDERGP